MALDFDNLSDDAKLRYLEKLPIRDELYTMTFGELEVVKNSIDKMAFSYQDDEKLCAKLMHLKSLTSLVGEYAKKRDEEYR